MKAADDDELSRLRLGENYADPQTIRCFDTIGVGSRFEKIARRRQFFVRSSHSVLVCGRK
jgi:hypothetical protein